MSCHKFQFWVPLINFEINKDRIKLGNDFVIEKPTTYEKDVVFEELAKKFGIIISSEYLLRTYIKTNKLEEKPHEFFEKAIIKFEKAIILFRLFKKEFIGFVLIVESLANTEGYGFSSENLPYLIYDKRLENKYYIDDDEIELLNEFFIEYDDIFSTSEFDLAVRYFNRSYSQHFLASQYLDIIFILENLFLRNTYQELSYKLSMRMAYVLGGNNKEKREEIFNFIKKSYDIRSKMVHGGEIKEFDKRRVFKLRELTKDSLKIFFKKKDLCLGKNLDEIILKGKS